METKIRTIRLKFILDTTFVFYAYNELKLVAQAEYITFTNNKVFLIDVESKRTYIGSKEKYVEIHNIPLLMEYI